MVWLHHTFVRTFAIESELKSRDYDIGNGKLYNVAWATRIQEIEDFGQSDEHLLPPDEGSGFLWRVHSITKYEEKDGGTYAELEGMAFTRDIPLGVRWLIKPVVERLSRISIAMFLRKTREAVNENGAPARPSSSCPTAPSHAEPYPLKERLWATGLGHAAWTGNCSLRPFSKIVHLRLWRPSVAAGVSNEKKVLLLPATRERRPEGRPPAAEFPSPGLIEKAG